MGRFNRIPYILGTIDNMCIYKMHGRYFFRSRSSLTGERVKTDPAFHKTMHFAGMFARASQIGSRVYAALPADCKQYVLYRKLTGEAMTWLRYGWTEPDVLDWLQKRYTPQYAFTFCEQHREQLELQEQCATEEDIYNRFLARINRQRLRKLRQGDDAWLEEIEEEDDGDEEDDT